jgi:nucleoside-diphosphate-sugar epimerase
LMLENFLFWKSLTLHDINKKREFVYIDDLIETLLLADVAVALPGWVINIWSGEAYTVKELIDIFSELLWESYHHGIITEESESRLHWVGNPKNMKELFGTKNTPFRQGIQSMIAHYLIHSH